MLPPSNIAGCYSTSSSLLSGGRGPSSCLTPARDSSLCSPATWRRCSTVIAEESAKAWCAWRLARPTLTYSPSIRACTRRRSRNRIWGEYYWMFLIAKGGFTGRVGPIGGRFRWRKRWKDAGRVEPLARTTTRAGRVGGEAVPVPGNRRPLRGECSVTGAFLPRVVGGSGDDCDSVQGTTRPCFRCECRARRVAHPSGARLFRLSLLKMRLCNSPII
jgi:hypothetical protein